MGKFPKTDFIILKDRKEAVEKLQIAKNFFHDAAIDAQRPYSMIAAFLGILDEVQLFIESDLDFDKLQKEIDSKNNYSKSWRK